MEGGRDRGREGSKIFIWQSIHLTLIELTMWLAGWQPTPTTADVTVTQIAGYVRVRILMNRLFFSYF